jgi:hypothetical protein
MPVSLGAHATADASLKKKKKKAQQVFAVYSLFVLGFPGTPIK